MQANITKAFKIICVSFSYARITFSEFARYSRASKQSMKLKLIRVKLASIEELCIFLLLIDVEFLHFGTSTTITKESKKYKCRKEHYVETWLPASV